MTVDTIAARNETIQKLRARLKTEESAVSILTRAAEQWKERAEAAEARVAGLERERDAACEAVGAIGAAATEAEDRMYGRFRQAEIERDEARAKVALADRLAEACRGIGVGNLNDVVQEIREALAAYHGEITDG